jgi:rare lipoprotein A
MPEVLLKKNKTYFIFFLLSICLSISLGNGCSNAVKDAKELNHSSYHPTQMPYEINGIWYYPILSSQGFVEEGIASWYGKEFHGRPTANGEPYDMHAVTAAHKTLPLETHVKVTHKKNGRSIIVRVNDRGPFVSGRIIDLSCRAAEQLDMIGPGTARVKVEAVQLALQHQVDGETHWEPEPVPDFSHGKFTIQVGAFKTLYNAIILQRKLLDKDKTARLYTGTYQRDGYYRVQVGKFNDLIEAHLTAAQFEESGFDGAMVVAMDSDNETSDEERGQHKIE